ncbi:hypothetical protein NQT66_13700 [Cellulophaga baltica]|nr:hypothetical protein [Cellulophaga baltica]
MKKKKKSNKKKTKKLMLKSLYLFLALLCLSVVLAILLEEPNVVIFFIFISGFSFFLLCGVYLLQTRMKLLKLLTTFSTDLLQSNTNPVQSSMSPFYSNPMYFHIFLIVLVLLNIVLSQFELATYNSSYYSRFYDDLYFQVVIAVLFSILGVLNPFLKVPEVIKDRIKERHLRLYHLISNNKKMFYYRLLACILVIAYFSYERWLVVPNFDDSNIILQGVDIAILIFVLSTTYRMVTYAKIFLLENTFRLIKTFSILTSSIFILVPLVPLTFFILHILNLDESLISFDPVLFLAFNLIMVYVEYNLNNTKKATVKSKE